MDPQRIICCWLSRMATLADRAKSFSWPVQRGSARVRSIESRSMKAPLHLYTRPNIAEWPAPSLLFPRALVSRRVLVPRVSGRILKKARHCAVVLVCRPEEALPVAAVLAVRGSWPKRGTSLHATLRSATTESLLAEEWHASRCNDQLHSGLFYGGQHPQRRDSGQQLRSNRRWTSDPGEGRAEASGELFVRRWEHRCQAGQWTGSADGLWWDLLLIPWDPWILH